MDILILIGIILLVGWAIGLFALAQVGWYIHLLLVLAIVLFLFRLLRRGSRAN